MINQLLSDKALKSFIIIISKHSKHSLLSSSFGRPTKSVQDPGHTKAQCSLPSLQTMTEEMVGNTIFKMSSISWKTPYLCWMILSLYRFQLRSLGFPSVVCLTLLIVACSPLVTCRKKREKKQQHKHWTYFKFIKKSVDVTKAFLIMRETDRQRQIEKERQTDTEREIHITNNESLGNMILPYNYSLNI